MLSYIVYDCTLISAQSTPEINMKMNLSMDKVRSRFDLYSRSGHLAAKGACIDGDQLYWGLSGSADDDDGEVLRLSLSGSSCLPTQGESPTHAAEWIGRATLAANHFEAWEPGNCCEGDLGRCCNHACVSTTSQAYESSCKRAQARGFAL